MAKLTEEEGKLLTEDNLLWQMAETQGYQMVLRPFLVAKRDQSFPDPSQFKDEAEFVYAAKVASVFKKVCAEILLWVDQKVDEAKALEEKKKDKKTDPFELGGV